MASGKAAAIPAQYAKFITALAAAAVSYLTVYGATWHLQAALVMAGGALAVLGVPNAPAPAVPIPSRTTTLPGNVTITSAQKPLSEAEVAQFKQELTERIAKEGTK